jgi:hypothetical protein
MAHPTVLEFYKNLDKKRGLTGSPSPSHEVNDEFDEMDDDDAVYDCTLPL